MGRPPISQLPVSVDHDQLVYANFFFNAIYANILLFKSYRKEQMDSVLLEVMVQVLRNGS